MNFAGPITCVECESPVGTSSGRCPFCGAELKASGQGAARSGPSEAAPVGYSEGALRYRRAGVAASRAQGASGRKPFVIAAIAGVVVFGGLYAFFSYRGSRIDPPAPAPVAPSPLPAAPPGEIRIAEPRQVDLDELSLPVQYRARAFDPGARLLSISASPVVGDEVDLTAQDAQIVFTYFSAKQGSSEAAAGRFVVTVAEGGAMQASFPAAPNDAKAALDEPLCVFSAAIRAARASGIPAEANISAVYEYDAVLGRALWRLTVPGQKEHTRYLDGNSCAIVTRR